MILFFKTLYIIFLFFGCLNLSQAQKTPEQQYDKAMSYFEKSEQQNIEKTVYWLNQASKQAHMQAQYDLAKMYYLGIGVIQNYQQAIKYFKLVASSTNKFKHLNQMSELDLKTKHINQNIQAKSQYELAMIHLLGLGVLPDYDLALDYLLQSIDNNYVKALNRLGFLYLEGLLVDQNYQQAIASFKLAANQGDKQASYQIKQIEASCLNLFK